MAMKTGRTGQVKLAAIVIGLVSCLAGWTAMASAQGTSGTPGTPGAQGATWLNGPVIGMPNWNTAGAPVTPAPLVPSLAPEVCVARERPSATPEERQVAGGGWRLVDYWQTQRLGDVAVVMAVIAHDGMCRPLGYNAFVFTDGRFAGTVSPAPMSSRGDGALIRPPALLPGGRLEGSFVRYAPSDPLCCPSRPAVSVVYRVEQTEAGPLLLVERPGVSGMALPRTGWGGSAPEPVCALN